MTWATLIPVVLGWLKTNWQGLAAGLVLGGAICGLKGCVASNPAPVAVATAGAAQSLSGTATASSGGSVRVPGRPSMPCPESKVCPECPGLQLDFKADAAVAGAATSGVTATASAGQSGPVFGLWAGAGATDILGAQVGVYGQIQVQYGRFAIPLRYDSSQKLSLGIDYRVW